MKTHTPGPWNTWRLAPESDIAQRFIVVANDGEDEICGLVGHEPDASLIAAAPELLAVARRVAESITGADGWAQITPEIIAAARAAVSKAYGT